MSITSYLFNTRGKPGACGKLGGTPACCMGAGADSSPPPFSFCGYRCVASGVVRRWGRACWTGMGVLSFGLPYLCTRVCPCAASCACVFVGLACAVQPTRDVLIHDRLSCRSFAFALLALVKNAAPGWESLPHPAGASLEKHQGSPGQDDTSGCCPSASLKRARLQDGLQAHGTSFVGGDRPRLACRLPRRNEWSPNIKQAVH